MISLCLILVFAHGCYGTEGTSTNDTNGFGYELLLTKMDYLEYKFLELQVDIKEQIESVLLKQDKSERAVLDQTSDILMQQKVFANHEALKQSIFDLRPRKHPSDNSEFIDFLFKKHLVAPQLKSTIDSCESEKSKMSGKYWLSLENSTKFQVYCEQTLHGGGWIVIQNRFNGSVDFYRNWTEYKNGFGSLDGEFWLGLDMIHLLTSKQASKLLIHLEDFNGKTTYAIYSDFKIGDENEKYILKTIEDNIGTLKGSLKKNKGNKFSTIDSDNDNSSGACAVDRHGAWWYGDCSYSNLNGLHTNSNDQKSTYWYDQYNSFQGLKVSKMMIK